MRTKIYRAKPRSNIKHSSSYSISGSVKRIKTTDYPENWRELTLEIKARDGNKCCNCPSTDRLEVHHILSLTRGGTNSKRNLITLCFNCHSKRHKHL